MNKTSQDINGVDFITIAKEDRKARGTFVGMIRMRVFNLITIKKQAGFKTLEDASEFCQIQLTQIVDGTSGMAAMHTKEAALTMMGVQK